MSDPTREAKIALQIVRNLIEIHIDDEVRANLAKLQGKPQPTESAAERERLIGVLAEARRQRNAG